jgi:hypothetical protein
MKKCLKPLIIRETKIKATMKYRFIPLRMASIKSQKINFGRDVKNLMLFNGDKNWCSHNEKQYGVSTKK